MRRLLPVVALSAFFAAVAAAFQFDAAYAYRYLALNFPDWDDSLSFPTVSINTSAPEPLPEANARHKSADVRRADLDARLSETETTAFMIVRDGAVVYRWSAPERSVSDPHPAWSISKCLTILGVGVAIQKGEIESWGDPIGKYVSGLDPKVAQIPLEQLADMTSAVEYEFSNAPWGREPRLYYSSDRRPLLLDSKIDPERTSTFHYNNINADLLGLALEAQVADLPLFFSERVWTPLQAAHDAVWAVDSRKNRAMYMSGGFAASLEDFARLGLLKLNEGVWKGQRLAPASTYERESHGPAARANAPKRWGVETDGFSKCWWTPETPAGQAGDSLAIGMFGQLIYVAPETRTVVVRLGRTWKDLGLQEWVDFASEIAHAD